MYGNAPRGRRKEVGRRRRLEGNRGGRRMGNTRCNKTQPEQLRQRSRRCITENGPNRKPGTPGSPQGDFHKYTTERETPAVMERRRCGTNTKGKKGHVHDPQELESDPPPTGGKQATGKDSPEKAARRGRRRGRRAREKPIRVEKKQRNDRRNDHPATLEEGGTEKGPLPKHHRDRKSTRLNSSHRIASRMPSSA